MMFTEGRIADNEGVSFYPWDPETALTVVPLEEARFSRGFLSGDPSKWFVGLSRFWAPLFNQLGIEAQLTRIERGFALPDDLHDLGIVEIDSEPVVIGFDAVSAAVITRHIVGEVEEAASQIVLEYLRRRLAVSFAKSWSGPEALSIQTLPGNDIQRVPLLGAVGLTLEVLTEEVTVWFGIGPRMTERLDVYWRSQLSNSASEYGERMLVDAVHEVSVELVELSVPPAMLIDYMRAGTVIDLEIPLSDSVLVRVDGQLWASGRLVQCNGSFAVEITETDVPPLPVREATTRVRVEISHGELDSRGLLEHAQQGAVLLTDHSLQPHVSLIISGEHVASALVGEVDGNFALQVLAK